MNRLQGFMLYWWSIPAWNIRQQVCSARSQLCPLALESIFNNSYITFWCTQALLLFQMHLPLFCTQTKLDGSCLWKEDFGKNVRADDFLSETTEVRKVFRTNNNQTSGPRVASTEIFREVEKFLREPFLCINLVIRWANMETERNALGHPQFLRPCRERISV